MDFLANPRFFIIALLVCLGLLAFALGVAFLFNPEPSALPIPEPPADDGQPAQISLPGRSEPVIIPAMTHEASENRRLREEHSRLLTSLPPSPTPVPDLQSGAESSFSEAQVWLAETLYRTGGTLPDYSMNPENWFDPEQGLFFYRPESGDWTPAELRKSHPYTELFYYEFYPDSILSFSNGTIQPHIARLLASEASELRPDFGAYSSVMVRSFLSNMGWEIGHPELPYVRVWTTFRVSDGDFLHTYAVGGLLELSLRQFNNENNPEEPLLYLYPKSFSGPVVLERLRVEGD